MSELLRNDAPAAAEAYRRGLLAGMWTLDASRLIFAMQDNPDELGVLVAKANEDPVVRAALRKLLAAKAALDGPEPPEPAGLRLPEVAPKTDPASR